MQEASKPTKRLKKRTIGIVIALPVVIVAAVAIADQVNLRQQMSAAQSIDTQARIKALSKIALQRETRASHIVAEALQNEQDRDVLGWAGYAAARIRDTSNLDLLQRRASEEPDDVVRTQLILYTAQLAGRDAQLKDWLESGAQSTEIWRQVGSAAGLLALGQPEGGRLLIDLASRGDHPGRHLALKELRRTVAPMAEAVGQPIAWPKPGEEPTETFWTDLRQFWNAWGTTRLLNNVLSKRYAKSAEWYELGRLLHARDKVARWFE